MPQFLKNDTILLLDGGIESYLLALYGIAIPSQHSLHKSDIKYAPIIGLLGTAAELFVKACFVQATDISSMYKKNDISTGKYRPESDILNELKKYIRDERKCIDFLWAHSNDRKLQKGQLLYFLGQFQLLQDLRAAGFHAGIGCSRDILITVAHNVYNFIQTLQQSKRLRPYLKNIPAPAATVRDREALIEDLSRRVQASNNPSSKVEALRNIYLVLPYLPEIKPDWIEAFDRIAVAPPRENDLSYLVKTLSNAHSIYLLKNRNGKDALPVFVDSKNPDSIPISIQNIKRKLSTTPDKFNNDVLSANTRLEEKRLDLPIEEFLIDLYAIGLEEAKVISKETPTLTAQQVWPFVAAAYSSHGTPRPCWFIIRLCDEMDRLKDFLIKIKPYSNGYFKRRFPELIASIDALQNNHLVSFSKPKDLIFSEIVPYKDKREQLAQKEDSPFTPDFLQKYPLSESSREIIQDFILDKKCAGNSLSAILEQKSFTTNDKKACEKLLAYCFDSSNINGLISTLRSDKMKNHSSTARKQMFFCDFLDNGPQC